MNVMFQSFGREFAGHWDSPDVQARRMTVGPPNAFMDKWSQVKHLDEIITDPLKKFDGIRVWLEWRREP